MHQLPLPLDVKWEKVRAAGCRAEIMSEILSGYFWHLSTSINTSWAHSIYIHITLSLTALCVLELAPRESFEAGGLTYLHRSKILRRTPRVSGTMAHGQNTIYRYLRPVWVECGKK